MASQKPKGVVLCQEQYGSSRKQDIVCNDDGIHVVQKTAKTSSLVQLLRTAFLPQGYPESVSSDYLSYQLWDTTQAFASSITGTLASQAVLKGVGVGDEKATVLAATMTWLLRDGAGMVGRILFAWAKGSGLDYNAKRWRLFADILNDISIFVRIIAPIFGSLFTFLVCFASVCSSIVGVAGGCTRAALTMHQARRNNMADVSAKDGSQETMVNLTGLICSLLLVPIIAENPFIVWPLFVVFTTLHIFANYRAVRSVSMETINQARLHTLVSCYVESKHKEMSVQGVNQREPVLLPVKRPMKICLAVSMNTLLNSGISYPVLKKVYGNTIEGYLLVVDFKRRCINIVLSTNCDNTDELQACFHAELINYVIEKTQQNQELQTDLQGLGKLMKECLSVSNASDIDDGLLASVLSSSLHYSECSITSFIHLLHDNQWTTDTNLLGPDEWRAAWNFDGGLDKTE